MIAKKNGTWKKKGEHNNQNVTSCFIKPKSLI
jgi:hypothetical protein